MNLQAQKFACGSDGPSYEEYSDFLEIINTAPSPFTTVNYQIPIHLTYVTFDDGQPLSTNYDFNEAVEYANNLFSSTGISFYICDVTVLPSSQYTNFTPSSATPSESTGLFELHHVDDAINVYQVNDMGIFAGVAWFPTYFPNYPGNVSNSIYIKKSALKADLAHELGHYLGLYHTFQNGPDPNNPNSGNDQYVDPNPFWNGLYWPCNAIGDMICDTPADPGNGFSCGINCVSPTCNITDPLGKQYSPDFNNIMSYTYNYSTNNCNSVEFSPTQKTRMINTLTTHPNRSFLTNSQPNYCEPIIPSYAGIYRYCESGGGDPFKGVNVDFENITQNWTCETKSWPNSEKYRLFECGPESGENHDITVTPEKTNSSQEHFQADNGLSTFDLVPITAYILNYPPPSPTLDTPYKLIAADANGSGSITTFDKIFIRRVLLGQINNFPVGSWRYIPEYYLDSDNSFYTSFMSDPFSAVWNDPYGSSQRSYSGSMSYMDQLSINMQNSQIGMQGTWDFRAIKIGDTNECNATINPVASSISETRGTLALKHDFVEGARNCYNKGEVVELEFNASGNNPIVAYQLGVNFDSDMIEVLIPNQGDLNDFDMENFGLTQLEKGEIKTLWLKEDLSGIDINDGKTLFNLKVKLKESTCNISDLITLDDAILKNEFYSITGENVNVDLTLKVKANQKRAEKDEILFFPNPFQDDLLLEVYLESSSKVDIIISDVNGRTFTISKTLDKGNQLIAIPEAKELKEGLLFYQVFVNSKVHSGKLLKTFNKP